MVTLNRPDRGNGLNGALKTVLRDILDAVSADDEVRAVVLAGAGRSFCVGQDLEEHAEPRIRRRHSPRSLSITTRS
jgi:2-(1,2-epoxy-1,2-dihydrophenyl)acetyl-CoA isomerase